MSELFALDAEQQLEALTAGLLALELAPADSGHVEACMRAAHSLKGAARIAGVTAAVGIAHALEDCFVAIQRGTLALVREHVDLLLRGVDLLKHSVAAPDERADVIAGKDADVQRFLAQLGAALAAPAALPPAALPRVVASAVGMPQAAPTVASPERALRVSAHRLDRLVGDAAESPVGSRRLKPFSESLLRLKRKQNDASKALGTLRRALPARALDARVATALDDAEQRIAAIARELSAKLADLETYDRQATSIAQRLYDDALACRMRPFADGIAALPRMVRDLGYSLGKDVRLDITGETTLLDRDVLERLDAPLGHLLRNAVDHGIELPSQRESEGKRPQAVIALEAGHVGGMLQVAVSDDGRGVDVASLRNAIVSRQFTNTETAAALSDAEVLEFLFLPTFTTTDTVTELSGRGVGLDAVKTMVQQLGGTIGVTTKHGRGTRFELRLPLSLSVVRTLLVEIGGEPYAFPLASIARTLKLPLNGAGNGRHFDFDGRPVGFIGADQILRVTAPAESPGERCIVVVGMSDATYGIVVDRFLGERELVVQALDPKLGKLPNIASGALMEDGSPVLILDVPDMLASIEKLLATGSLQPAQQRTGNANVRKRLLVVDDSLTVREFERKLLQNAGYDVEVAVNGMDGWNTIRSTRFDLVITDIDMPRLDGIELVTLIKNDPTLRSLPVVIVSYKDRAEDRRRGLDAGADYILSKSSFHDETLLQAVVDLIGVAA